MKNETDNRSASRKLDKSLSQAGVVMGRHSVEGMNTLVASHPIICRLGIFAAVLAIGFVCIRASHEPVKHNYWCDLKTDNCYARLAMPMEKFKWN